MKKCLKISIMGAGQDSFVHEIQKKGAKLNVEGTIQYVAAENEVKIIACGTKEEVDKFVDLIHKEAALMGAQAPNIEPFVKVKDYRGALRIIE